MIRGRVYPLIHAFSDPVSVIFQFVLSIENQKAIWFLTTLSHEQTKHVLGRHSPHLNAKSAPSLISQHELKNTSFIRERCLDPHLPLNDGAMTSSLFLKVIVLATINLFRMSFHHSFPGCLLSFYCRRRKPFSSSSWIALLRAFSFCLLILTDSW